MCISPCFRLEVIRQRYADVPGELLIVELEKDRNGLGLSLAGNRDRSCMSIFVVGITAGGPASRDGHVKVGDELLEVKRANTQWSDWVVGVELLRWGFIFSLPNLPIYLSVCLSLSIYLLFIHSFLLPIYCLFVRFFYLSNSLSIYLSIYLHFGTIFTFTHKVLVNFTNNYKEMASHTETLHF